MKGVTSWNGRYVHSPIGFGLPTPVFLHAVLGRITTLLSSTNQEHSQLAKLALSGDVDAYIKIMSMSTPLNASGTGPATDLNGRPLKWIGAYNTNYAKEPYMTALKTQIESARKDLEARRGATRQ